MNTPQRTKPYTQRSWAALRYHIYRLIGRTAPLPCCDELFMQYFDRWYSEEDRSRKRFLATRPDTRRIASKKTCFLGGFASDDKNGPIWRTHESALSRLDLGKRTPKTSTNRPRRMGQPFSRQEFSGQSPYDSNAKNLLLTWADFRCDSPGPDTLTTKSLKGVDESSLALWDEEGRKEIQRRIDVMTNAARSDWPTYLDVTGEIDLEWIRKWDKYFDRKLIWNAIQESDPTDFANEYVVYCCEFGCAIAYVLRSMKPRLIWRLDWPYWESSLVDPECGTMIPPFHWAIKKMSEYGWDDGFAEKILAVCQVLDDPARLHVEGD